MISIKNTETKRVVRVTAIQSIRATKWDGTPWEFASRDQWRNKGKMTFNPKLDKLYAPIQERPFAR